MKDVIVTDTSVLINFLKIERLDLLAKCSLDFFITEHVRNEITEDYPEQLERFEHALKHSMLKEITVSESAELEIFSKLMENRKLGVGECSAIAVATHRNYLLAIDDNLAIKFALSFIASSKILRTQDLMIKMIHENLLDVLEADIILNDWSDLHRFRLKIDSFQDLLRV